ncbi:hypothetical protein ACVWDB_27325, partial [Escherichia coli]
KEQNFAVNLCRYTLKYFYLITTEMVELCGIEPQTSCVQSRRSNHLSYKPVEVLLLIFIRQSV